MSRSPGSSNTSYAASDASNLFRQPAQWQQHITLPEFTKKLDAALQGVFPNQSRSRYTEVFVLLVRWQVSDPKLPVYIEIEELRQVFSDVFHFNVEVFEIPSTRSHMVMSQKILEFAMRNGDNPNDLKIFYYGGHSRLTESKDLILSRYVLGTMACFVTLMNVVEVPSDQ